jgi:Phage major capsid protein E
MAFATFTFPSSAELIAIEQEKVPRLTEDDPIFRHFPMRSVDANLLLWEQLDNYTGLQQLRGLNGDPPRIKKTGMKRYKMEPGVYGEFEDIDEAELTERRSMGTFGQPIDLTELVTLAQDKLLSRRLDRIRAILWTLLSTGTFSVATAEPGGIAHTDSYTTQTYDASDWNTVATATPLADLRAIKLLARGKGVSFGAGAEAFMNQKTANVMLNNTNAADLGGRRQNGLSTINNMGEVNQLLMGDGLPSVVPWDEGYLDDAGAFVPFIPDNVVVVVGKRVSGTSLGEFRFTRNANNPDLGPGPYTRVIDQGERTTPRTIQVHDGFNGGVVLYFPGGVVRMAVGP